jgi:hypothetical protein
MWLCKKCSESVDDNFDVCWNCQTAKAGSAPGDQTLSNQTDQPTDDVICTADGKIMPVSQAVASTPPVAPDLGYRLALLCGLGGLGFVIALFNLVVGQERRGFQAIVIQWGVIIWILAMLGFLMDLVGFTGRPSVILLFATTLVFPLPALWVLRRVPWPASPSPASLATGTSIQKRGGCLTAFLMFALTSNPFIALFYLLIAPAIQRDFRQVAWVVPVSVFGAIVSFVLALAIWKWKKWGVYGYAASYIIGIIISLSSGLPIYSALLGLLGLAILISLVRPVWNYFE